MRYLPIIVLVGLFPPCSAGCASAPRIDTVQVQRNADALQRVVNGVAREAAGLAPLVDVGCALRGRDSEACKSLEGAYDLLRAGINSAQSAIGGYRELGFGLEAVEFAVRRLEESVARLSGDLQEVRDAVTRMVPVPSVGASAAPAGAEPAAAPPDAAVPEVAEGATREAAP